MEFKQFLPSDILKPYVRHYYIFESDDDIEFDDTVFPSGDMEMIFNLGGGKWQSAVNDKFFETPPIELWGQITKPLAIKSKGKHTMLGIKFFTHTAAYFFNDELGIFNNHISDIGDIIGSPAKQLHNQLLEAKSEQGRIDLVELFLLKRLIGSEKRTFKINKVAHILNSIKQSVAEANISRIASRHNITARYLQQLVYRHTGLTPVSFNKINRFQLGLKLIAKNESPLTSIAYQCGYFDQSHFIRDFKSFTGVTPSSYLHHTTPVNQLLQPVM
ncbi:MAG: helix-turn-helix transcriptional regulator [Bacteroidota bacterium]